MLSAACISCICRNRHNKQYAQPIRVKSSTAQVQRFNAMCVAQDAPECCFGPAVCDTCAVRSTSCCSCCVNEQRSSSLGCLQEHPGGQSNKLAVLTNKALLSVLAACRNMD
jgi:hypothetical protein